MSATPAFSKRRGYCCWWSRSIPAATSLRMFISGCFLAASMGSSPRRWRKVLANPALVIIPKALNIVAGGFVLGLLLLRWLPQAVTERGLSDRLVVDLGMLATTDGLTALFNRRHFEE